MTITSIYRYFFPKPHEWDSGTVHGTPSLRLLVTDKDRKVIGTRVVTFHCKRCGAQGLFWENGKTVQSTKRGCE